LFLGVNKLSLPYRFCVAQTARCGGGLQFTLTDFISENDRWDKYTQDSQCLFHKKASASSIEKTLARCWVEELNPQQHTAHDNRALCLSIIGHFSGLLNPRQTRLHSPITIL